MRHDRTFVSEAQIERLLHYMPACAREATNEWAANFAADMARRSHWRNWRPSPKQAEIMRQMVAELFANSDCEVIER